MRTTCLGCENIIQVGGRESFYLACRKTAAKIPHFANNKDREVIFFGIPIECPLPDEDAKKGDPMAFEKVRFGEI